MSQSNLTEQEAKLYFTIGQNIEKARVSRKMDRKTLARKLGVTQPTVGALESGTFRMNVGRLVEVAKVLNVDWRELVGDQPTAALDLSAVGRRLQHELAKLLLEDQTLAATVAIQRASKIIGDTVKVLEEDH